MGRRSSTLPKDTYRISEKIVLAQRPPGRKGVGSNGVQFLGEPSTLG
jgi:hypothetical protein